MLCPHRLSKPDCLIFKWAWKSAAQHNIQIGKSRDRKAKLDVSSRMRSHLKAGEETQRGGLHSWLQPLRSVEQALLEAVLG